MGVMREEEEQGRWVWIPAHEGQASVTFQLPSHSEQAQGERIIRLLEQLVVQTRKPSPYPSPHQAIK